ncbi:MAG: hypothetical protein KME07_17830 [Pegethrix bostrychoides GSE-TBD4-15B]|jgi:hypothetical protein|uniref:Uncharacterized protein n=1 Tax=Pegethrix bostrychoides GSE-TBD4-15B TaxID=2839662 RepID=A0A951PDQ9_9CYAN|nr:hypothetical protein [Pegethrix bostrychoides GSE-TBD4-15B]
MAQDFRSDDFAELPPDAPLNYDAAPIREPVRLIVVSSRQGVTRMIQTLHLRGVVSAHEWSALQPEPMTGKWMSVATKYLSLG